MFASIFEMEMEMGLNCRTGANQLHKSTMKCELCPIQGGAIVLKSGSKWFPFLYPILTAGHENLFLCRITVINHSHDIK